VSPRKLSAAESRANAERAAKITLPPPEVPPDFPVAVIPERIKSTRNRVATGTRFDATDRTGEPVQSPHAISLSTGFEVAAGYGYSGISVREGRRLIFGDMVDVDYAEPGMNVGLFALLDATRFCAGLDLEELIILDGLADRGMTQQELSGELGISEATVSRRVQSIRKKARAINLRICNGHATHAHYWRHDWDRLSISERWTYHFQIAAKNSGGPRVNRTIKHPDWQRLEAERIEMDRAYDERELAVAIECERDPEAYRAKVQAKNAAHNLVWGNNGMGVRLRADGVIPLKPDAPIPTWNGVKKAA
jgi:transcriptional regulator with XRE-family HTH domain